MQCSVSSAFGRVLARKDAQPPPDQESLFVLSPEPFDGEFEPQGIALGLTATDSAQSEWAPAPGVTSAAPFVVSLDALCNIAGDSGVERAIGAPRHVDEPNLYVLGHGELARLEAPRSGAGRAGAPLACVTNLDSSALWSWASFGS
jgi:hypothetical protein